MLTSKSFIRWADDHLVVLISHNELGHEPIETKDAQGKTVERCPHYPGLLCRDHLDIAVQTENSRDSTMPVVPFVQLCPNSFLILPNRKVEAITEEDQFLPAKIKKVVKAVQAGLGDALDLKAWKRLKPKVMAIREAIEDEAWRKALTQWAALRKDLGTKTPPSMDTLIKRDMALVDEEIEWLFEDALEETMKPGERVETMRKLLDAVDVAVEGTYVPTRARIQAWMDKHAATKAGG